MKILNIQAPRFVKNMLIATPLLLTAPTIKPQQLSFEHDVFVKSTEISADDIDETMLLAPEVKVANDTIYPAVVIDLSEGRLYHYDYEGYLANVYPVASGKKSTPTKPALKIITEIESYPYSSAPKSTKRYKTPNDYGTHLINMSIVNTKTGEIVDNDGQFIHGTFKEESIGKKVSNGCIRVYNDVVDMLAKCLDKDQYVLIKE